jgi:retinol dehydrogenase-12
VEDIRKATSEVLCHFLHFELSSLALVKTAVKKFLASTSRLDILICNTGLIAGGDTLNEDYYEIRIAVNLLGHALLMDLLVPLMVRTAANFVDAGRPRVLSLSSAGHRWAPQQGIKFDHLREDVASNQLVS